MNTLYMIELELPNPLPAEFMAQIPANWEVTHKLLSKGTIQSYTVSLERSRVWMVVKAQSEFEAEEILAELPLSEYMTPHFMPVMFHKDAHSAGFPAISLN